MYKGFIWSTGNNSIVGLCFDIGAQPPPPDAVNAAAEFSHSHYSRDDDLISLQIEAHR